MEYTIGEYIRSKGKVYSSSGGYKYFSSIAVGSKIHLRCTLFMNSCKGTAILDLEVNLLYFKSVHNHPLENYKYGIYALKTKCKRSAQCSSRGVTRGGPGGAKAPPLAKVAPPPPWPNCPPPLPSC